MFLTSKEQHRMVAKLIRCCFSYNVVLFYCTILKNKCQKMGVLYMNDYKFDRFYYIVDKSNEHYISEIENLEDSEYTKTYKGKMYCPCCKKPQITLVKKNGSSFLRTYPNQLHGIVDGKICPYTFDTASDYTVRKYVQELKDTNKIKSMLEAAMRKLLMPTPPKTSPPDQNGEEQSDPLLIKKVKRDKTVTKNIIPHYSFKSWGKNIPQDRLLLIYGKVYIELKEVEISRDISNKSRITKKYIHFMDMHTKKLITACQKPNLLNITNGYYSAVILGTCYSKVKQGRIYYNLRVNYPDLHSIFLISLSP